MKTFKVQTCQRPCFNSRVIAGQDVCCKGPGDECMEALRIQAIIKENQKEANDEKN